MGSTGEFLSSIDVNKNGQMLISSSNLTFQYWDGAICVLDIDESFAEPKSVIPSTMSCNKTTSSGVCDAKWTHKNQIVAGNDEGDILLFTYNNDAQQLDDPITLREHDSMVLSVAAGKDTNIAVTGSHDSQIKIWDLDNFASTRTYKAHDDAVCQVALSPHNDSLFISCSLDSRVLSWDTRSLKCATSLNFASNGYASSVNWNSLDTNQIAIGTETGLLVLFDLRNMQSHLLSSRIHERLIRRIMFNDKIIVTAAEDCTAHVHELASANTLKKTYSNKSYKDYVVDLAWHPKERNSFFACSWDGQITTHKY